MTRWNLALMAALCWATAGLAAREFTVLVYNVENLFDVDGAAEYSDYRQAPWEIENPYTPLRLLNKLRGIGEVLRAVNGGAGPEVVLFQEIEFDRTPFGGAATFETLLNDYEDTTVEALLTEKFDYEVGRLSATFLLLKHLQDIGLGTYYVAEPDPAKMESFPAQQCVVFSKFPISWVRQRPLEQARDLLVAGIDVEGDEFVVLNNHWKSGASSARTEPIRVQNAHVVRAELEAILLRDPGADVIIAGDLNSYYNQSAANPDWGETGVNDVLGSSTHEVAHLAGENRGLYNLWGELPIELRGSEVYRGYWGTLMQMLVSRGLYDEAGITYVDGSFERLILSGSNVGERWNLPRAWNNVGDGVGFSDHLPILARFRSGGTGEALEMTRWEAPTDEPAEPAERLRVPYERLDRRALPDAQMLESMTPVELAPHLGTLFQFRGRLSDDFRSVQIGERVFDLYPTHRAPREALEAVGAGRTLSAYGLLDSYRGAIQFVIEDASWVRD